jgi:hypothetical protein
MTKLWLMAVTAVVVMSLTAAHAKADEKDDVGKGAKAWATALMEADAAGMKSHSVGTAEEIGRWEGMAKMIGSFKKLGDAASAKYGEEGAQIGRMFRTPDFSQLESSKVAVSGDDATLTGKDSKVMKLKKEAGEWKVVLSSMPDAAKINPKQVNAMATAASATADEIKDGKYPTYRDAMIALGRKMAAAAGGRPGGAPGGAPAK